MLAFFRTYQKFFFVLVTGLVIASFLFFGAMGTFLNVREEKECVAGYAIDGSEIQLSEIRALARFLAADWYDLGAGAATPPNLFNDGVIRKDLIGTGIAETLVRQKFDLFKGALQEKKERSRLYKPYEHPQAPFLSASAIWERAAPAINRERAALLAETDATPSVFRHLATLYQLQASVPPEWLRRILVMQEQQFKWLQPDARLRQEDLSLFGFRSLSDWFGQDFVDCMALFVYNSALMAEQKGYRVALAEAKGDLRRQFQESLEQWKKGGRPLEMSYQDQLRLLGMDETKAANAWRKVLLFRRYFQDLGASTFLDRLPYSEFAAVAGETAVIDLYRSPDPFKVESALDLFTFQTYLQSVAVVDPKEPLQMPLAFRSVDEVAKSAPELVAIRYTAKVSVVDKREVGLRAPSQELWKFETEEKTWNRLKQECSLLPKQGCKTAEERFQALEHLPIAERTKVDLVARRLWVDRHPEAVEEALGQAPKEEKSLVLSMGEISYPHVDDPKKLGALFEQILETPEVALTELQHFGSKEAVFRFENIAKVSDPQIKTFAEALEDGSLKGKVAALLKKAKHTGSDEEIAVRLLKETKRAIEESEGKGGVFWEKRFLKIAREAKEALQREGSDPRWIKGEAEAPLTAQFKWEKISREVARSGKEDWVVKESFALPVDDWSSIHAGEGEVSFFHLQQRKGSEEPILDPLMMGKGALAADVQRLLAAKIFRQMLEEPRFTFPLVKGT